MFNIFWWIQSGYRNSIVTAESSAAQQGCASGARGISISSAMQFTMSIIDRTVDEVMRRGVELGAIPCFGWMRDACVRDERN